MQDNDLLFCEDIYLELITINGINFTRREIDVVSCLLSARRTSQIASILSIAPRTVTTHFRNIMLRLGCNSQEGIINFIEKSRKIPILRNYYANLVIELAFEKNLRETSKLRQEREATRLVVYWQDFKLKNAFTRHLGNHLAQAGINAELRDQTWDQIIGEIEDSNKTLLLFMEKNEQSQTSQEFSIIDFVDLTEQQNYYFSFFEILKKLLLNSNLDHIFISFKEHYMNMQSSREISHDQGYDKNYLEKEKIEKEKNRFGQKIKEIFDRKLKFISFRLNQFYIKLYLGMFFFFTFIWGIGFFVFYNNKQKKQFQAHLSTPALTTSQTHSQQQKKADSSIRTDLTIPVESSFLPRPEIMTQIDNKFKGKNGIQAVALIGPGGAGKTTLARQYAHQQKSSVIWEINAETHESLVSSFESLAQTFAKKEEDKKILKEIQDIKDAEVKEKKVIQFVKEYLSSHPNWFFIFDNVEKITDIQKYFPLDFMTWGQGKIILTTRDSNIENNKHISSFIQIGELSPEQKVHLFTKIITHQNETSFTPIQVEEVKAFLEHIPPFPGGAPFGLDRN